MTEEPEAIAIRDWRLQAITTLAEEFVSPWTGQRHPAGSPVWAIAFAKSEGALLQFAAPNPAAMYLSMADRALATARELLSEAIPPDSASHAQEPRVVLLSKEGAFLDAIEHVAAGVIFAYSSIEAFANESIPDAFTFDRPRDDARCTEVYTKDQIERAISLDTKLHEILPGIFSVASPKGTQTWQNYIVLKNTRDRLVHLKSADWRKSDPDNAQDLLWSRMLHKDVSDSPSIALATISHYLQSNKPRWLRRAEAIHLAG